MEQERIQANLSEKLDTTEQLEPDSTNAERLENEDKEDDGRKKKNESGSESDEHNKNKVGHFICVRMDVLEQIGIVWGSILSDL